MVNKQRRVRGKNSKATMPVASPLMDMPDEYKDFLSQLKGKIEQHRTKAILAVNSEMILMYWKVGQQILEKQNAQGWGAKVIDRLSYDLKKAYPSTSGFSARNLKYMRKFAESWPDYSLVETLISQIPWRTNLTLIDKVKEPDVRRWYAEKILTMGLSRSMLEIQIEARLHEREGKATNNFDLTIPEHDSDLVAHTFKDPYVFDFLAQSDVRRESDLEQQLIEHIHKFLVELGQGFAFVGRQVLLEIGDSDFYADLLFYHLRLRCFVVVELKVGKFEPGHVGQLNMYIQAVDELLRHKTDKPTIGLLLVKTRDEMVVEYSLNGYNSPISVANWQQNTADLQRKEILESLPSIEEIQLELGIESDEDDE